MNSKEQMSTDAFLKELIKAGADKDFARGVASELGFLKSADEIYAEHKLLTKANLLLKKASLKELSTVQELEQRIEKESAEFREAFIKDARAHGHDDAWVEGFLKQSQDFCTKLMEKDAVTAGGAEEFFGGLSHLFSGGENLAHSSMGPHLGGNPAQISQSMGQAGNSGAGIAQQLQHLANSGAIPKTSLPPMRPSSVVSPTQMPRNPMATAGPIKPITAGPDGLPMVPARVQRQVPPQGNPMAHGAPMRAPGRPTPAPTPGPMPGSQLTPPNHSIFAQKPDMPAGPAPTQSRGIPAPAPTLSTGMPRPQGAVIPPPNISVRGGANDPRTALTQLGFSPQDIAGMRPEEIKSMLQSAHGGRAAMGGQVPVATEPGTSAGTPVGQMAEQGQAREQIAQQAGAPAQIPATSSTGALEAPTGSATSPAGATNPMNSTQTATPDGVPFSETGMKRNWYDIGGMASDANTNAGNAITNWRRSQALKPMLGQLNLAPEELEALKNNQMPASLAAKHPELESIFRKRGVLTDSGEVAGAPGSTPKRGIVSKTMGAFGGGAAGTVAGGMFGMPIVGGLTGAYMGGGGSGMLGAAALTGAAGYGGYKMLGGGSSSSGQMDSSGMPADRNRAIGGMSNNFLGMVGGAAMLPMLVKGTALEGIPTPILMALGGYGGYKLLPYLMNKMNDPRGSGTNSEPYQNVFRNNYANNQQSQQMGLTPSYGLPEQNQYA